MSDKASVTGSMKTRSSVCCSSKRSMSSSVSKIAVAQARAEAEAAKTEAAYAIQENELKLRQAELELETKRLEMSLERIRLEKRAAATAVKADILEAAVQEEFEQVSVIDVPAGDSNLRTENVEGVTKRTSADHINSAPTSNQAMQTFEYTQAAAPYHTESKLSLEPNYEFPHTQQAQIYIPPLQQGSKEQFAQFPHPRLNDYEQVMSPHPRLVQQPRNYCYDPSYNKPMDPHSLSNAVFQERSPVQNNLNENRNMSDIIRFMARRELISTGLMQFNDQPECFRAWRASFMNSIRDLDLSASEQLDLLVKWLGKDSAEYARRIRTVHVNHPEYGLQAVWDRLNEYYGAPEVIESSLFKKLENFPKIQNKDGRKLRELGDLLMEIQAARADEDLLGLSYLDTSRGVNPIVQKLPFYLQEKWLTTGFNYKEEHRAPYPPFSFFVNFVCQQARMRNDPGFILASPDNEQAGHNSLPFKPDNHRAIAVLQTGVSPITQISPTGSPSASRFISKEDPAKHCLLHNKPHPLYECRGFRDKPIEERKALLKQYGVCYRCCKAIHLAKNCNEEVSCTECGSNSHIAALHPGPASTTTSSEDSALENGGEATVSVTCTKVCGKGNSGRSCSKICLVKVYPANRPDAAVHMYAVLDDQSNRSLARSDFFSIFGISGQPSPYSLKTCAGTIETKGRQARNFMVEPVSGDIVLSLPPLIECNEIPNNRTEIPTPEVASSYTHLKHLSQHIPSLDPQAPILLLLGRDIIRAHKVRRQVNGPHNAPYAQKLDLGWVIVGDVCIDNMHKPAVVCTYYTNVLRNKHPSLFQPRPNNNKMKKRYCSIPSLSHTSSLQGHSHAKGIQKNFNCDMFQTTRDDDKEAPSIEDLQFKGTMNRGAYKDEENICMAPLPFRTSRPQLPDSRSQALECLNSPTPASFLTRKVAQTVIGNTTTPQEVVI